LSALPALSSLQLCRSPLPSRIGVRWTSGSELLITSPSGDGARLGCLGRSFAVVIIAAMAAAVFILTNVPLRMHPKYTSTIVLVLVSFDFLVR
jgi:hypothetical protein